jgi:uncharacterized protein
MIDDTLRRKHEEALGILRSFGGAVVAFSGGVDSTLLLRLAREALGDRCLALTAVSPSFPERELRDARDLVRELGVRHEEASTHEMDRGDYAKNPVNRCYFCKSELFDFCFAASARSGLPVVVYGATRDDEGDHRPGMQAARERGVRAPLLEADLGKEEIRALSRELGLRTWDKPAMPCLSSRFPYGTPITVQGLSRVERAEEVLRGAGFPEVRVRFHGDVARVEVPDAAWPRLADPALRRRLSEGIRAAGFRYVSLDLEGFRSGRLNEEIAPRET